MAYIRKIDYLTKLPTPTLDKLTGSDDTIFSNIETLAREMINAALNERYDPELIWFDLLPYSYTDAYVIGDAISLEAEVWQTATIYNTNDLVVESDKVYRANAGHTSNPLFSDDSSKWDFLGTHNAIYTVYVDAPANTPPSDVAFYIKELRNAIDKTNFDNLLTNSTGDIVYFEGNYYINTLETQLDPSTSTVLTIPTDTNHWTWLKSRHSIILQLMKNIVLFELHGRISPRNIPELFVLAYEQTTKYLSDISTARKKLNPELPLLYNRADDSRGVHIQYGGRNRTTTHLY